MAIYGNEGRPEPLGCSHSNGKVNFALFAPNAAKVRICLFFEGTASGRGTELPLYGPTRGVWHIEIDSLPEGALYAYRVESARHSLDHSPLLCDPYAKQLAAPYRWGDFSTPRSAFLCKADPLLPFDWQQAEKPNIPLGDLIIYEMHIRGFTKHPSSGASHPGTYAGAIEKIPYLKTLGINAVELLPIFEFDETFPGILHPEKHLPNYWGYHPIHFFAPMSRFASDPSKAETEFKTLVRALHKERIEVILDVVYNHTGEGKEIEICWKGIDRSAYYMLDEKGHDRNYSGCGNTFQCNSPAGMQMILESLRYWAEEMQVDGFRFDLASILTRGMDGHPLSNPPILEAIANDPVLQRVKLIAEPWDAAGLHQTSEFPKWGPWSVWNDRFRDHVRKFIKGTDREAGAFAAALCGSEPLFHASKTPQSSVNFIAAHDGFCLRDLVSYQHKHNLENGEKNKDGSDQNYSWNCGREGPTDDPAIEHLRERQMRNFLLALFLSQGIPMLLMGDEIGHTRFGNNNPYNQDNPINWIDWNLCKKNAPMLRFVSALIEFRKTHPVLRNQRFLTEEDISWHGPQPDQPKWTPDSRFIAYSLSGIQPLYAAFNAGYESISISLPSLPPNQQWRSFIRTEADWEAALVPVSLPSSFSLPPYSAILAEAFS